MRVKSNFGKKGESRMKRRFLWLSLVVIGFSASVFAGEVKEISLPARPTRVNVDIVNALEQRRTTRDYATTKLSLEDLSAVLWAANGVNRPDGKRTAPSAYGKQYIDIYVVTETGGYLYDAPNQKLVLVTSLNVKDSLAGQGHVAKASYILVLAADMSKVPGSLTETKLNWAHSTAGTIAENVHLMCAARAIGTGIVAGIKTEEIRQALNLAKDSVPLYVMPLGYQK
jgi:nitroreductase